jgi:hypothetical protein
MGAPEAEIVRLLRGRRVADMVTIQAHVGERSRRSIFRDLERVGYLSSFTHRGSYYTLEDIPRFNNEGLWFHDDVGFSRFGTLKHTVAELVPRAVAGSTQGELAALLRVRVHNTLLDLLRGASLGRRVVEGLSELVYVSPDPARSDQQIARRLERLRERAEAAMPSDEIVLAILAETVRASRVEVPPDLVVRRLAARNVVVSREAVERVLERFDLLGGKKNS